MRPLERERIDRVRAHLAVRAHGRHDDAKSAARIALPTFDGPTLITLIGKLCTLDSRFIPNARGYSLYLRPTLIGTQRTLGVGPPGSALLYVIACPVGPYFPTGMKAVELEATDYAVRAWPGGVFSRFP